MKKNRKQVKVGGIFHLRGEAQAGNPLCHAFGAEEVID